MDDDLDILTKEYEKQAQHDLELIQNIETTKLSKKQRAEEQREKALAQKITEDNKGYQLMQKMGYTDGTGLGLCNQGRIEPLPISVKRDRKGIGEKQTIKAKKRKRTDEGSNEHTLMQSAVAYRQAFTTKLQSRKLSKRLKAVRILIEDLDEKEGIGRNPFWLPKPLINEEGKIDAFEDDEIAMMEENRAFDAAIEYLRQQHIYCFWCGCKYKNSNEMATSCPGPTEQDHEE